MKLQFQPGKPFRVMQIADIQEGGTVAKDTLKLINAALEAVKPDLVVLTGDQIKGYSPMFTKGDYAAKVKTTLDTIVEPMTRRGIPFAPTFGNHDSQGKVKKREQMEIYTAHACCVNIDPSAPDCGSYTVPVYASDGERIALNFYLIDSNGDEQLMSYTPVREEQIAWYREQREALHTQQGEYVPSLVFQHIPVPEYYQLLKRVKKRTAKAVRGFQEYKNQFFVLDESKVWQQDFFRETPATPQENTGEFAALREKGEVFAMYVGHDHINSFVGKVDGIDLGYTPGAGFNVYGPGIDRAVRILEFKEEDVRDYRTWTLPFRKLVGSKVEKPLMNFLYSYMPTSVPAAMLLARRVLFAGLGFAAVLALILYLLK